MNKGRLTMLIGGQYGSEGKGAIASCIANEYDVHVRVGSPNAGHTIYWNGEKHVMQSIPCGWINPKATIIIGRGATINMKQFMKEIIHIMQYYPSFLKRLRIDPEAGILDDRFHEQEGGVNGEMHRRIGSTGEGVGPCRVARMNRDPSQFRQFKDVAEEYGLEMCMCPNTPEIIAFMQDNGNNVLIEGTQGSGLSLYHSHWPYCTSVDTNAAGIMAEVGIAPSRVTDVLMVCRTYPIRVAGNSGPMKNEISWDELSERLGVNVVPEKTTVTKKTRRIAEWDDDLYQMAVALNAPSGIALTFADYVDPSLYGATDPGIVRNSVKLAEFMKTHGLSFEGKVSVKYVGTGPETVVVM